MNCLTVHEFIESLRRGPYTSLGSYPVFFLTDDGEALSYIAAKENVWLIARAIRDGSRDGWRVIATDVNWEDANLYCAHSGDRIESAYAEPETT